MGAKGAAHTFTDVGASRDTWVKTPQGWRLKLVEELSDRSTIDGKPLRATAPPAPTPPPTPPTPKRGRKRR